jgi:hypothetical protein
LNEVAVWWHADAYRLLGIEPTTDPALSAHLGAVERRLGRQVPAAVREWFTTTGAAAWLADRRGNFMVSSDRLGEPIDDVDHVSRGELAVETDCQYCCRWVVRLSTLDHSEGSNQPLPYEDPAVDLVDPEGKDQLVQRYADRFSEYVLTSVWDAHLPSDASGWEFDHPLRPEALPELRRRYPELPTTFSWAGNQGCDAMFRFDGDVKILLAVAGDTALYSAVVAKSAKVRSEVQELLGATH